MRYLQDLIVLVKFSGPERPAVQNFSLQRLRCKKVGDELTDLFDIFTVKRYQDLSDLLID